MPYVPLDDHFHSHRKVLAAGLEAVGAHTRTLSWIGANLTDGHVPAFVDDMICGTPARARKIRGVLLDVGLRDACHLHKNCTTVHDWGSINDPGDELKAAREKERERKQKWRQERRLSRDNDGTITGTVDGTVA